MRWDVGAVTLPVAGTGESGDAAWTWVEGGRARIVLVDAAGHGPRAATACRHIVGRAALDPRLPPRQQLAALHACLEGSVGAVAMVVDADLDGPETRLRWAGVGNVRLWTERVIAVPVEGNPGLLGVRYPRNVDLREARMDRGETIFVCSDGLHSSVWRRPSPPAGGSSGDRARQLVHAHARDLDDATLVVLRPRWEAP